MRGTKAIQTWGWVTLAVAGCVSGIPCETPLDCPRAAACWQKTCEDGWCGTAPQPAGPVPDGDMPGDCKASQCDGVGNFARVADDFDLPEQVGACWLPSCHDGGLTIALQAPGTLCGARGGRCHADGRCDSCPDPTPQCADPDEPNDDRAHATHLGILTDLDMFTEDPTMCRTLHSPDDVDWYRYSGLDSAGIVDPGRHLDPGTQVRVCAFFECKHSPRKLTCPAGTTPATASGGMSGCCADGGFELGYADLWCGEWGVPDDAEVWIRVDKGRPGCQPYELGYHF